MCLTVFDIVLVGWDLQHEGLNCQHWQVTIKRGHMLQCFLLVAKNNTKNKKPSQDERKGFLHRNKEISCNIWAAVIHQKEMSPNVNKV